ncbi:hypothetical protein A0V00_06155 [Shigella dysenteriae]|nr:hypothetical protein A0V00_06155 [Shigella dysenteriae]
MYTFGEPDIRYYNPALYSSIINPDEVPVLMRMFQLNDIVCGQPKVISGSIHPLAVGNYTAVDFFHSAELIGRITLNRSAE